MIKIYYDGKGEKTRGVEDGHNIVWDGTNQPSHKNITLCTLMAVEGNSLLILLYLSMFFF
jgi:hypothetical protein